MHLAEKGQRVEFARTHVIDALAIIPVFQPLLIFRSLRILWTMRIARGAAVFGKGVTEANTRFRPQVKDIPWMIVLTGVIVAFGLALVYGVERNVEGASITTLPDAFWWGMTTATTGGSTLEPVEGRAIALGNHAPRHLPHRRDGRHLRRRPPAHRRGSRSPPGGDRGATHPDRTPPGSSSIAGDPCLASMSSAMDTVGLLLPQEGATCIKSFGSPARRAAMVDGEIGIAPNDPQVKTLRVSGFAKALLVILGLGFIGLSAVSWLQAPITPVTSVTRSAAPITGRTDTVTTGGSAAATPGGSSASTSQETSATTDQGAAYEVTTTRGPTAGRRSEVVTLAILGLGVALVLTGSGAVKSVSGPGGWTVDLADTIKDNTAEFKRAIASARGYTTKRTKELQGVIVELQARVAELEKGDDDA